MAKNNTLNAIFWIIGTVVLVLLISQLPVLPQFTIIAPEEEIQPTYQLYEFYDEGERGEISFFGGAKVGNVVTIGAVGPNENFEIDSIDFKLKREGSPGTIYVKVYEAGKNGVPYGEVLSFGEISGNDLSEDFEVVKVDMTPHKLNSGEKYVFIIYVTGGDEINKVFTRVFSRNLYAGGDAIIYSEVWNSYKNFNLLFKVYGTGPI